MSDCQHTNITWAGPLSDGCQLSNRPFNGVMYDANLPGIGWGNWDEITFKACGGRLGTGFGQKYVQRPCGHWEKVEG